jgi:hypothetical protein
MAYIEGFPLSSENKTNRDTETILMALDQISQTIEVMNSVVGRLRDHLHSQEGSPDNQSAAEERSMPQTRAERTLH